MMGRKNIYIRERTTYAKKCCALQEGERPEKTWKHRQHMDVQRKGLPQEISIHVAQGNKVGRGSSFLPFLRNIAGISTVLENTLYSMRDYQWTRVYQTLFVLLSFCSVVYRNIMTSKIHVFPFPNDLYLMCDLLLLLILLLARCKTLWHHLFEVIINCLNGLQLGYNCRYALCVVTGVIAPQLLYLFLYLSHYVYYYVIPSESPASLLYFFYLFP